MLTMRRFRRVSRLALPPALLCCMLAVSCSRPSGFSGGDAATQADPHKLPFHQEASETQAESLAPGVSQQDPSKNPNAPTGLPFNRQPARTLPAGTLVTVRLQDSLTSAKLDPDLAFSAVLDEPVVINDVTVVSRGTAVQGRVESAHISDMTRDAGYLRLTLDAIAAGGKKEVPIHTSSLFARGTAMEPSVPSPVSANGSRPAGEVPERVIRIQKGRRLTFRLATDVVLRGLSAQTTVQNRPPNSQ
jgi:hypothetical protein